MRPLFYISYNSPLLLGSEKGPEQKGKRDSSLHGRRPQSDCSVFGGSGHEVTGGGELHPSDDVLMADKAESSRLWSQIPDHQALIR